MTDDEAIAAVLRGERVTGEYSLHTTESPDSWKGRHSWRTIYCNYDQDVVECRDCGEQSVHPCSFDEDFA